jgi:DoxX-like family
VINKQIQRKGVRRLQERYDDVTASDRLRHADRQNNNGFGRFQLPDLPKDHQSMAASKSQFIAGWVLSGLVTAFLLFSASGKFVDWPGKVEMLKKMDYTIPMMQGIGVVEVIATILYIVPQTSFLGCILLTGYLGGATEVHVRMSEPFIFPVILGVIVWLGYALRRPDVIKNAFSRG